MGKGSDQTTNVVAGSCCAVCCGVCFLVIGLPMLIAGIVLVQIYKGDYDQQVEDALNGLNPDEQAEVKDIMYKIGIGLIVVSVICVVAGVVMVVLLCTGCCGRTNSRPTGGAIIVQPGTAVVVTQKQGYSQGYEMQQPYAAPPGQQPYAPQQMNMQQPYLPQQPPNEPQQKPSEPQQPPAYSPQEAYPQKM